MRVVTLIILAAAAYLALSAPRFYLVLDAQAAARPEAERTPAYYGMHGGEVECELRAAELRKMPLTPGARCEAVPLWRHWWNELSAAE